MRPLVKTLPLAGLLAGFAAPASAYVGPGLGLGAIGVIVALIISVLLAVVGLLWYPLKRRFGKKQDTQPEPGVESDTGA